MPGHAPNNKLAALLAEAGWSAGDLARSVRALGAAQGLALRYDRTAVAHWLTGTRPRPPAPHLIAAALSERIGRLVTVQDAGFAPAPQAPSAPSSTPSAEADPVHHLLNLCRTETDPERRSFLAKTAYAVTTAASALPDFGALPVEGRKEPTGIQVATCDVEALKEMTQTFATLADRHGGAHVRAMLASYLADQVGRLLHAPANGALHNDLLRGAGQLTHLLALTNDDSGHPGLAQRYFRTALDLATRAGDARLYAITLRALSAQALRLGHLRHALQLAEASISALPAHADPAPRAFLLAQRAYAGAAHGDRRRAPADLALAEEHHAQATAATGPFNTYPRAGLDYQRAQTLHALGLPDQALAALQSSARHRSPDERKPAALTHARLAEMQLDMGHVDAAVIHGHLFLDLCPYLHSTRIDTALQRLRQHLARYPRQRQAVTLAERLRDACRVRRGSFRT